MTESPKQGLSRLAGAVVVLCSVGCEIGKQISNYSINYYNGGSYPLPQTILVRLKKTTIRYKFIKANFRWSCWSFSSLLPPSLGRFDIELNFPLNSPHGELIRKEKLYCLIYLGKTLD